MSTMEGMEEAEAGWSLSETERIIERSPEKETITLLQGRAFKLSAEEAFDPQILTCSEKRKVLTIWQKVCPPKKRVPARHG
jgi:hypothetical protein